MISLFSIHNEHLKTRRILIVDDEPYNILGLQLMISQAGFKSLNKFVDRAYNGLEALKMVK